MTSRRARSLADYSSAARRRKLILILPALVLASATAIAMRNLPTLFESTARLRFTSTKTEAVYDPAVYLREFRDRLTSRETLAAVVVKDEPGDVSSESVINLLRPRVGVKADSSRDAQPGSFLVSYRATDPELARRVTAELADRLVTQSPTESSAASETAVSRKRATDISIQLRELESRDPRLADARSDLPRSALSPRSVQPSAESIREQQMTIDNLKDQQYKINQQLSDVEKRIASQRQIVDQQKKGSTLRDNPTYAVLIAKRTELQGQRDTLINRQDLTDKHPRVLAILDQISAINRQIEELRQLDAPLVSQSAEARELAALESERNRLRLDLEVNGRELARRSDNGPIQPSLTEPSQVRRSATTSRLTPQYLALRRSHQEASEELQNAEARLAKENPAGFSQVVVLEPPDLPNLPVSPNRPLLISIAAILGLVIGVGFVLPAESRRFKSLQDARDVEYYTRLPLLAAIPATLTASECRRARWRSAARIAFATAASVVATLALTKIFVAADIFALIIKK